jgi:hypothetical protein
LSLNPSKKACAMWLMSDSEALAFIAIVAVMVALALAVTG